MNNLNGFNDGNNLSSGVGGGKSAVEFMPQYKVLTLWQPWASLLAYGAKKIETRPKPTTWTAEKGTYLIHAASKWTKEQAEICIQEPFKSALMNLGYLHKHEDENTGYKGYSFSFPMSSIIGSIEVTECCEITYVHPILERAMYINSHRTYFEVRDSEYHFGDYTEGRYAWLTQNPRVLKTPIPYKGGQGYYVPFKGDVNQLEFL